MSILKNDLLLGGQSKFKAGQWTYMVPSSTQYLVNPGKGKSVWHKHWFEPEHVECLARWQEREYDGMHSYLVLMDDLGEVHLALEFWDIPSNAYLYRIQPRRAKP
jgi:hypothetical protein